MNTKPTIQTEARARAPRRTRVLVLDDEAIVAMDLSGELQQMGYEVVGTAGTAIDALRLAELAPPDIALLDIRLQGDPDGIDVGTALAARLHIPIIFLTADADRATLDRALRASPAGYLTKPIGGGTLRTTIEVAMHNAEKTRANSRRAGELAQMAESLREQSFTDALTGLYNRRHFDAALARELQLADRNAHPVSLLVLDLDDFKHLNDTYGHPAGDAALFAIAGALRARLRGYDIPCRIGGDEFAIIVPGAELSAASDLGEQLRVTISRLNVLDGMQSLGRLSISVGVATYPAHGCSGDSLLRAADQALYVAKRSGRDRVITLPPLSATRQPT